MVDLMPMGIDITQIYRMRFIVQAGINFTAGISGKLYKKFNARILIQVNQLV
jgi:hypothetical protein